MEKYKDDEFTQCIQSIFKDENDKKIQTILNLAETFFTTNMDKNDIQTIMANICQGDSDIIGGQKSKTLRFRKRMINRIIGGGSDEPDTCFICCEEYSEEKPSVEIHPSSILYKHNAHQTCINMWIQEKGDYATCPICRAPISDDMKSLALDGDVIKNRIDQKIVTPETLTVSFNGYIFELSLSTNMSFKRLSHRFIINTCIDFSYTEGDPKGSENEINLNYYYYWRQCRIPLIMPHKTFFQFLDLVALKLKAKITLSDASSKDFKWCQLPFYIFALAGDRTFYEQHGFENDLFNTHISKIRNLTLLDFVKYKESSKLKLHELLPQYGPKYTEATTVQEVAKFIVDTCKGAFKSNYEYDTIPKDAKYNIDEAKRLQRLIEISYPKEVDVKSIKRPILSSGGRYTKQISKRKHKKTRRKRYNH